MMNIFIDCEFNGFGGELISMALVDENGREFYEVLPLPLLDHIDDWVLRNVIPVLDKQPIPKNLFKQKLEGFLAPYHDFKLIADWPDDIRYFMEQIIVGPGIMMNISSFECAVYRWLDYVSDVPHNALEDARALFAAYETNETNRGAK